jgi:hypothetical protein
LIIEYFNLKNLYREKGTDSFQIILYEKDNSIIFNYGGAMAAPGNLTFVGIENSTGTSGLRYRGLSSTTSTSGLAVRFFLGNPGPSLDQDGDGYTVADGDCNDNDASINPGAEEICGDGIDNNCNGSIDEGCGVDPGTDQDGDGYTVAQGDCNDNDAKINPGAKEICGDGIDNNCDGSIDEGCDEIMPLTLYFPLLSAAAEKTYLGLVNTSKTEKLTGSLSTYDKAGNLLAEYDRVSLGPLACQEFQLAKIFPETATGAAYVSFASESVIAGRGYCRLVDGKGMRTASYPAAVAQKDSLELDVPNLLYGSGWTTEVAALFLSKKPITATIEFNNGASAQVTAAGIHGGLYRIIVEENMAVTYQGINVLLGEIDQKATAATIKFTSFFNLDRNKDLALGAVLYRRGESMSSALLQRTGAGKLYVGYLAADGPWWSGLAFYNPDRELREGEAEKSCSLVFTETGLSEQHLASGDQFDDPTLKVGEAIVINGAEFADGTHGLKIESACGISGIEFMGTGSGMGCISLSGKKSKAGVFMPVQAGVENDSWSGIALLNPDSQNTATVTLNAYNNRGDLLASRKYKVNALSQLAGLPETLLGHDISAVASIHYQADQELLGLVINYSGSKMGSQVDVLPAFLFETVESND